MVLHASGFLRDGQNVNALTQAAKPPMRILIVHNSYQQHGGEDVVVQAESELLKSRGHDVAIFARHNDEITAMSRTALVAQTFWSRPTAAALGVELRKFRPDVTHVHNVFPLISPAALWVCASAHVPVVQTLHNFRLLCPQGSFLRDGRACEECLGKVPWRGVVHACYRHSHAQSAVLASTLALHRALGTWRNKVTLYIALNEFCRSKFIAGGIPAQRIVVKPNFVDIDISAERPRSGFLFVGRLSVEKGVSVLAHASALAPELPVRVVGTGPEASDLMRHAPRAVRLGKLDSWAVTAEMSTALALVLPSVCYDSFPRALVEAYACGLPVIAARIGPFPDLVSDGITGLLFKPGDPSDLAQKMRWAQLHPTEMATMGRNARIRFETNYSADRNFEQLIAIYERAIAEIAGLDHIDSPD